LSQQPRGNVPFWTYFHLDAEYTQFRHSGQHDAARVGKKD
jgi:hypothetical protein